MVKTEQPCGDGLVLRLNEAHWKCNFSLKYFIPVGIETFMGVALADCKKEEFDSWGAFFSGFVNNVAYSYKTKRVKKRKNKNKNKQKKKARARWCIFVIIYFTFPVLLASTYNAFEINRNVYLFNTALMTVFDISLLAT